MPQVSSNESRCGRSRVARVVLAVGRKMTTIECSWCRRCCRRVDLHTRGGVRRQEFGKTVNRRRSRVAKKRAARKETMSNTRGVRPSMPFWVEAIRDSMPPDIGSGLTNSGLTIKLVSRNGPVGREGNVPKRMSGPARGHGIRVFPAHRARTRRVSSCARTRCDGRSAIPSHVS